jgi:hypothetical protein
MSESSVEWRTEDLGLGVLRIAFTGKGGIGSEGIDDGLRMSAAAEEMISVHKPRALLIDLRSFDYVFGNWIGSAPIRAARALGGPYVCVLASGNTLAALQPLWADGMEQIVPLFADPDEALTYLRGAVEETDA